MSWSRRLLQAPGAVPAGLAALCFAVAFAQRPGKAFTDARIELTVDPGGFLGDVANVWSSTGDLGHVSGGLFAGYLFPAGPWYALVQELGIPDWVGQRLLLGVVLALSAWGAVKLMDALWGRPRGLAHLVAGLVFALSPFVAVSLAVRGTVPLFAHAIAPWVLLAVHRGLQESRSWRWPAALGLLVAAAGGSINAANIFWVLLAGLALAAYEATVLDRERRDVWAFAWRGAVCLVVASAWWLVPLAVQGAAGADFQQFAEQPGTIWETTSMSESLRQLGFWTLYLGAGFGRLEPQLDIGSAYLFDGVVIVATLLVPLLALAGLRWTRGWRYAPFFGLLAVAVLLVMFAGFPPGTPLRRGLIWVNDHLRALEVVRTTYKAGPLLALALACLAGPAAEALVRRVPRPGLRPVAIAAVLALPLLAALPLLEGRAVDSDAAYDEVPREWTDALSNADSSTPPDRRVMLIPGALFGYYRWGYTNTSVGPPLADRPVLVRETSRFADPRASQLQDSTDTLVQQQRLVPGQLPQLLRLMGVGRVVVPTDLRTAQSGSLGPAGVEEMLRTQPGLARADAEWGGRRRFGPPAGRSGPPATLPSLSAYGIAGSPGTVRLKARAGGTVVDGDAEALLELAAHGALDARAPLFQAGDLDRDELASAVRSGAALVFSDAGRRRIVNPARFHNELGRTLGPDDPISADAPTYQPFGTRTDDYLATARYSGLRYLRSPEPPAIRHFPERRPFAALDGRLGTAWLAEGREDDQRYIELEFLRPRRVGAMRVYPQGDSRGRTSRIAVSVNGGSEREFGLSPGWNRVELDEPAVRRLRIRIASVSGKLRRSRGGGLAEVRLPGPRVREWLRLPGALARAAEGLDLSRAPVSVLLERTTADFPYRAGAGVANPQADSPLDMVDAEPGIERELSLPVARSLAVDGWASVAPAGNDAAIDRLAGVPAGWTFASSSRFEGVPARRASSAFDRAAATSWVGDWLPRRRPWIELRAPRPLELGRFRVLPGRREYRAPTRVNVSGDGRTRTAAVAADGTVVLRSALRARRVRVEIDAARYGRGVPRSRRLRGVAVSELRIPGLRPPSPRRSGRFASDCDELRLHGPTGRASALVEGSVGDLDVGRPLRLRGCGPAARLSLPSGHSRVSAPPGRVFRPDHLRFASGPRARAADAGTVVDPGEGSGGERDGVRLRPAGASWLVLGETYSPEWRAWCRDGDEERELGAPRAIDGFANGWPVGPGCREARFEFAPQKTATTSHWLSAIGVAGILVLLLAGAVRRHRHAAAAAPGPPTLGAPADPTRKVPWGRALAIGAVVAAVGGFLFALRAGVVLGPATVVLLRLGVSVRRLLAIATALLAAIPVLYLLFPAEDEGGFNFDYALETLGAHWVAVAAVCCVGAACALDLAARRAGR